MKQRAKGEPLYLDIKSTMAHCMQVETGFLSQDGFVEIFDRGSETLRKWNSYIRKFLTDAGVGFAVSEFVKNSEVEIDCKMATLALSRVWAALRNP